MAVSGAASQKKHFLVGARARARPGHPLAATDDAGTDAGWWGVAVRRSGDHRVGKIEVSERVHLEASRASRTSRSGVGLASPFACVVLATPGGG